MSIQTQLQVLQQRIEGFLKGKEDIKVSLALAEREEEETDLRKQLGHVYSILDTLYQHHFVLSRAPHEDGGCSSCHHLLHS